MDVKFIKLCLTYILFLFLSIFLFAFNTDISVGAKVEIGTPLRPKIMSVTGNAGMNTTEIVSSTCYSWKKPGTTCEVKIQHEASIGAYCGNSSMTFVFDKNEKITKHSGGNPSGGLGSSSTYCNWSATVQAFNYDKTPPMWINLRFNLSGSTCTKTKDLSGMRSGEGEVVAQCLGPVTATSTSELDEYESGVPTTKITTKCKPGGGTCYLNAVDNVGNKQSNQSSYGPYNSIRFKIGKDTTKCSATTISITGGTNYNGYYVGTVTCTAKCTKDNLKVGSSRTGTTTGTTCSAKACDAAGNCTNKNISVKRDKTAPTCTKGSIISEGTSNGYRLGKVTAKWTGKDGQTGLSGSNVYSKSTNDNTVTSLGNTIKDKAGNRKTCPTQSWKRDNVAPTKCAYSQSAYSQSAYSNSSVTVTAWCSEDKESGCFNWKKQKKYTGNGTYSGSSGINVYDKTEQYSAAPKAV